MRSFFKYPLIVASALFLSQAVIADNNQPPVRFNPASVSPTPQITPGCEIPSLRGRTQDYFRPEFPYAQARKGNSGFAVLDFQINAKGKADNIEIIADAPKDAFSETSISAVKKLRFQTVEKWTQTCSTQKFRFVYQYAHSAECNPKAFPSDITMVCVTMYVTPLR